MRPMSTSAIGALLVGGALAMPVQAVTVYTNNFDSAAGVASGVVATFTPGAGATRPTSAAYQASFGSFLASGSNSVFTELTLGNLPAHTGVGLGFVLAFLNSWDSRDGSPAPDNFDVYVDDTRIASYTYNNASGSVKDIGGGTLLAEYVQFDDSAFYSDTIVDMGTATAMQFAHSASTLKIGFVASGAGWQFDPDEAWGVDNLQVMVTGVPEPATWASMCGGLLALGALARRRRA